MKKFNIYSFCCTHTGAKDQDLKKWKEAIKAVKDDPDGYWIHNGDILEFIPPGYKISQRGQDLENDDQYLEALEQLKPIRNKCLFIRGGNHDSGRSVRIVGVDIIRLLAQALDVPFYDGVGYTKIVATQNTSKKNFILIASGHGTRTTTNPDLQLHALRAVYPQADVFVLGHDHKLYAKPFDGLGFLDGDGEKLLRQWYVRTGCFMKYAEYAREQIYGLTRTGWAVISLTAQGKIECCTTT